MYKLAIFDLDGTLLNTLEDLANACNYALSKLGFPTHQVEQYKTFVGGGRYRLISGILPLENRNEDTIDQALALFDEYYEAHMIDMTKPYDGICEMLEDITEEGVEVAIVSNKPHEFTVDVVEKFFGKTFKVVYGHRIGYPTKPEPESVLQVIDKYRVDKTECIYIGDSNVDIKTARNANIKSIGVSWGFRGRQELQNEGADFIVETSEELKNVILKQKAALGKN